MQKHLQDYGKRLRVGIVLNWITDSDKVYPKFILDGDQIIRKISMTRVEGEKSRFRHYLARLHRKTFCYSLVRGDVIFVNQTPYLLPQREESFSGK